ncbi:hypothetical protein I2I05_00420 [Hymenobacter sp. BT683]|uniref:Uncharacterized protein n=1 Tax=Hymenobacter jeongseonensis TaxID=2791027 RepID=A0ABS0IBW8_9BACT|nr:hypothetical protein [Hymenobacter jeongseonensis]MBF9235848.1 hypothetical protein [Hymenobacter jeongseonensis]
MEDYAAKMLLKTDAALREYVTGHAQYREAAVLAALDELRRRGQPAPEEATLRPGLEIAAAEQRAREAAAEAEREDAAAATVDDGTEAATGPALYSPITIVLFSIPFSFLAGGALLGLNLWRLDRKRAILGLVLFVVAYMVLGGLVLKWALPRYGLSSWYGPLFNLPAVLVYILWFWPRNVGNVNYRSRNWFSALLVCFALGLGLQYGLQKLNGYIMEKQPKEVREQMEKMLPK